jgi:hypothetical protein
MNSAAGGSGCEKPKKPRQRPHKNGQLPGCVEEKAANTDDNQTPAEILQKSKVPFASASGAAGHEPAGPTDLDAIQKWMIPAQGQ